MPHSAILEELARRIALSPLQYPLRVPALNLLYETRSVKACEDLVAGLLDASGSDEQRLGNALRDYLRQHVRANPQGSFLSAENASNEVELADGEELFHVWNAEAFLVRVRTNEDSPAVAAFLRNNPFGGGQPNDVRDWLSGAARNAARLTQMLELHNAYRMERPWNPVWAGKWSDAPSKVNVDDSNSWLDAVGLPLPAEDQHLILFRYPAERVKDTLRRPTHYEAGWFPFHFPSPPCAAVDLGGFAMHMDDRAFNDGLISEYIHAQVDWRPEDVVALRSTSLQGGRDIQLLRSQHHTRLKTRFGEDVIRWMKHPDEVPEK